MQFKVCFKSPVIRAMALAFSKADVPTKDTNDILIKLVRVSVSDSEFREWKYGKQRFREFLDRGVIPTGNSAYLNDYKAAEGKLNVRTNKLFKFDTIELEEGWQDDREWQEWDWTKARALIGYFHIITDHYKLPLSRLNNLKEIDLVVIQDLEAVAPLLRLNPRLESLSLFLYPRPNFKELALASCAMKQLKTLSVTHSLVAEFAAEYMKCLPVQNVLEKLVFADNHARERGIREFTPIAATPQMIEKLHLKHFSCDGCRPEWAEQTTLDLLIWKHTGNHAQLVQILENILEMESLVDLELEFTLKLSPEEFKLLRQITQQVKKMKIKTWGSNEIVKELPGYSWNGVFFSK